MNLSRDGVYFIEAIGLNRIKIGAVVRRKRKNWSGCVWWRWKELNTASPVELRVVGMTTRYYEHDVHEKFSRFRIKGEWFEGTPELWSFIGKLKNKHLVKQAMETGDERN